MFNKDSLNQLAQEPLLPVHVMYNDIPAGIRVYLFYNLLSTGIAIQEVLPYIYEAYRLSNIMMERNAKAKKLEDTGLIEDAIKLYEDNVKDHFFQIQPYESLYQIYLKAGKYDHALQVCKIAVDVMDIIIKVSSSSTDFSNLGSKPEDFSSHKSTFAQRIKELETPSNIG